MKPKEISDGIWYVRALEQRFGNRWDVVMPYEPDEWILSFRSDGYYVEMHRPHRPVGRTWQIKNGIISTHSESTGNYEKCIFRDEEGGTYLYYYNDFYQFSSDPDVIVKTYAHTRQRIERMKDEQ